MNSPKQESEESKAVESTSDINESAKTANAFIASVGLDNTTSKPSAEKSLLQREWDLSRLSLQDCLTLGYLYLLALGLVTEVIYYKFFGIDILYYSGVVDVILSPVIFMFRRLAIFIAFIAVLITIAFLDQMNRRKAELASTLDDPASEKKEHPRDFFIKISALAVFFMFVGGGIGSAYAQSKRIKSGEFNCTHTVEYLDGKTQDFRVIGQNYDYLFGVAKGTQHVTVIPIRGNLKRIDNVVENQDQAEKQETSTKPEFKNDSGFGAEKKSSPQPELKSESKE